MDLKTRLHSWRAKAGRRYVKHRLKQSSVTLISDDCWAGRLYEDFGLRCLSPFIGMGFTPSEYLNFITHLRKPGALNVLSVSSEERGYPIITTPHARLFGAHDKSDRDFQRRYERRCSLIDWEHIYIKIDLGRKKYREEDIHRWNELKLPNSVAFHPNLPRYHEAGIHNGVSVSDWIEDGYHMFPRSCQVFDVINWLNTGTITSSRFASLAQATLFKRNLLAR